MATTPFRSDSMVAISLKWVANHISACKEVLNQHEDERLKKGLTLLSTNASAMAIAMARPSRVLVPRPNSSMIALEQSKYVSWVWS